MRDIGDRQLLLHQIAWAAIGLFASGASAIGATAAEELDAARRRQAALSESAPHSSRRAAVRATFVQLEKKYPRDPAVKNACAEFLWSIGDRAGAMARWREAAELDGKNATVLNHLGGGYLASGEIRQAYHFFTLASDADPANALYHFNAANVAFLFRHDLGGTEEKLFAVALKHFADASRLAPADPEYARAYAEAFYSVPHPDWRAALVAWTCFRELSTNKDFALLNLARVHMKLGEKENARACLAEVKGAEFAKLRARLAERIDTE